MSSLPPPSLSVMGMEPRALSMRQVPYGCPHSQSWVFLIGWFGSGWNSGEEGTDPGIWIGSWTYKLCDIECVT